MVHTASEVLKVVGGGARGGIIVRDGKELSSQLQKGRLLTGTLVKVLESDGARIHYELLTGSGPQTGWVSSQLNGNALLVQVEEEEAAAVNVHASPAVLPQQDVASTAAKMRLAPSIRQMPRRQLHSSRLAAHPRAKVRNGLICQQPLRPQFYRKSAEVNGSQEVHPECSAQWVLQAMKEEDDKRRQEELAQKRARRRDFGIGWHAGLIPSNVAPAQKLGLDLPLHGQCCVVYEGHGLNRKVRLEETYEPSAAVNLEYLSVALRVRRKKGREPFFSLDPKSLDTDSDDDGYVKKEQSDSESEDAKEQRRAARRQQKPCKDDARMQVKRFEPRWLAGTSVGDIMFQSDYYLKELSMGEHDQPVIGMRSGFDYSEEEAYDKEWSGREWFMVRHAELLMSPDNVVVPQVTIGVEAREQVMGSDGSLEDAKITRSDHPLVRYAEAFSRNFDLIAERKSAIYHLRELAKACVVAKFLHEQQIDLPSPWLELAPEKPEGPWEIPQLWNERCYSKVHLKDGGIVDIEQEGTVGTVRRGVYGGVDLRIQTLAATAAPPSVGPPGAVAVPGVPAALAPQRAMIPRPGAPPRRLLSSAPIQRIPLATRAEPVPALVAPRGVDLNLDNFELGEARILDDGLKGAWYGSDAKSFWNSLESGITADGSPIGQKDLSLMRGIFHPRLSDRRLEGDKFMPPDAGYEYANKLAAILETEKEAHAQRLRHFFSQEFDMEEPGPLFPHSWKTSLKLEDGSEGGVPSVKLEKTDRQVSAQALRSPIFERATEDGIMFRIYRPGTLEVRTTQAVHEEGNEQVGAVFSVRTLE